MAKPRKRHTQQVMFNSRGKVTFDSRGNPKGRGGKRRGAGRKPKGERAGAPHKRRPQVKPYHAVHVVLRVTADVGSLRKRHMYQALRQATITTASRERHDERNNAFRIVHISLQHDHVHLIVEADHKLALSRGMQGFQISAAKHVNRIVSKRRGERRRGSVFPDRFHQEIIKTPRHAHRTLGYVLNNWRKHHEDRTPLSRTWNVDPFSTGVVFDGWKEREQAHVLWRWRETYEPMVVYLPKTWLLREGWRKYGLIPFDHVPSSRQIADV